MNRLLPPCIRLASSIALCAAVLAGCGGGGGSGGVGGNPPTPTPPATSVVVTGTVSYQRVPFKATAGTGLNPNSPVQLPVHDAVLEALSETGTLLAQTTTDAAGFYSVTLNAGTNVKIRVKAQSLKTGAAPTWNFRVLNNTNSDALYVLDSTVFSTGTVATSAGHDLLAASGWTGTNYTATRAAAPFAILDTVLRAKELVVSASAAAVFPPLDLYWSPTNIDSTGALCPDTGNIGTSFYIGSGGVDECAAPQSLPAGIYILGAFASDTDEFDQHVLAHEFGHYIEDQFSRSDSIGGIHGPSDRLDLRVAFGEGWGDAFSGMTLNDPVYRDSQAMVASDFGFNFETDSTASEGWFSESSVSEILWDIFDGANEPGDTVALGFPPIFAVMTGAQKDTDALTSIFPFANALRSANPGASGAIGVLLADENISGTDAFGAGEGNDADDPNLLPVYTNIDLGTQKSVCSRNKFGSKFDVRGVGNKLGNRTFLRFDNDAPRNIVVTAIGATNGGGTVAATDPDIIVWRRGAVIVRAEGSTVGSETSTMTAFTAGTYIIDVFDYALTGTNTASRCMTVSVTGS